MMEFEFEKQQTAVNNALKEVDTFGRIMTQSAAEALGMPIGTMSFTVEQKLLKAGSNGSSGGGSKKLSENVQNALDGAKQRLNTSTDTYSAAYTASLYGIDADELPAYQANQYLNGLVRNRKLTEKQAQTVKEMLGI